MKVNSKKAKATTKETEGRMQKAGLSKTAAKERLHWGTLRLNAAISGREKEKGDRELLIKLIEEYEGLSSPKVCENKRADNGSDLLVFRTKPNLERAALRVMRRRLDELDERYGPVMRQVYGGKRYKPNCKIEVHPLTKKLASCFADMDVLSKGGKRIDRNLDLKRVLGLRYAIMKKPIAFRWAYVVFNDKVSAVDLTDYSDLGLSEEDQRYFRENGNHSSWAVVQYPEIIQPGMLVEVEEYTVGSMEEAFHLWTMFDNVRSSRKPTDICNAAAVLDPRFQMVSGANLVKMANQLSKKSHDKRVHEWLSTEHRRYHLLLMGDLVEFWGELLALCDTKEFKPSKMSTVPVIRSIIDTWEVSPALCRMFWMAVVTADKSIQPAPALRQLINSYKIGGGPSASNDGKWGDTENLTTMRHVHAVCNTAWNQWRDGCEDDFVHEPEKLPEEDALAKETREGLLWGSKVKDPEKRTSKDYRVGHEMRLHISVIPVAR